ncbi:MAG: tetratricopeptide repeat protein [Bacteroidia bacterium]
MKTRIITILLFALAISSCSTKRNTVVSRGYHNLTARYNGYYYSRESIKDGEYKLDKDNKENYDKILPVFVYPTPENVKSTFPEFDKAIKKSSSCIQKHAIKDSKGNEIPTSGKWIDNNWINIGKARFYKREFFSGIEALEYVVSAYSHSDDKFEAMLWLVKSYNEIGSVSQSEQILTLLRNEQKLPKKIKKELPALEADYFFRKGLYTEASTKLMAAVRNNHPIKGVPKKLRARYSFIIAQMLESQKDYKRARKYYYTTIRLKPKYEMVFYAKIKLARLVDVKRMNSEKTKKELLKMSKEFKNSDYRDVIFYTLGEIEEKEDNLDQAVRYYKKSVQTSSVNPTQKALSYLKLGEINFEYTNYELAQAYYDSTLATLPKDYEKYEKITNRQETLNNLVSYLKTIKREDSLQKIAQMSEAEREAVIARIIQKVEEEEQKAQEEKEKMMADKGLNMLNNPNNSQLPDPSLTAGGTSFYFYNQNTKSFGISDFIKKWGNRKNEDNWRRANKELTIDDFENPNNNGGNKDENGKVVKNPKKTVNYYMKNLPLNDSLMAISTSTIIEAFYLLGTTYKEDLKNYKKSNAAFEELNKRYNPHKYQLNSYYQLYKNYASLNDAEQSNFYKEKILAEFPESEFAILIKNPKAAEKKKAQHSAVEKDYTKAYKLYTKNEFQECILKSDQSIEKHGENLFTPKFMFIQALSYGKLNNVDTMEIILKKLVALYPNSDITPNAKDVLMSIKKHKNPNLFPSENSVINNKTVSLPKDTFQILLDTEHFLIVICPDDPKISSTFKNNLNAFCTKFYSNDKFSITSSLFGTGMQMITLKSFKKGIDAVKFIGNVSKDESVFKDVDKNVFTFLNIASANLPMFYKKRNISGYLLFYNDNYSSIDPLAIPKDSKLK